METLEPRLCFDAQLLKVLHPSANFGAETVGLAFDDVAESWYEARTAATTANPVVITGDFRGTATLDSVDIVLSEWPAGYRDIEIDAIHNGRATTVGTFHGWVEDRQTVSIPLGNAPGDAFQARIAGDASRWISIDAMRFNGTAGVVDRGFVDDFIDGVGGFFGDAWDEVEEAVTDAWSGAKGSLEAVVEMLKDPVGTVHDIVEIVKTFANDPIGTGEEIAATFWRGLTRNPIEALGAAVTNVALGQLTEIALARFPELGNTAEKLLDAAREVVEEIGEQFEPLVNTFVSAAGSSDPLKALGDFWNRTFGDVIHLGPTGITSEGCGIFLFIPDAFGSLILGTVPGDPEPTNPCGCHDAKFDFRRKPQESILENFGQNLASNGEFFVDILEAGKRTTDPLSALLTPIVATVYTIGVTGGAIAGAAVDTGVHALLAAGKLSGVDPTIIALGTAAGILQAGKRSSNPNLPRLPDQLPSLAILPPAAPGELTTSNITARSAEIELDYNNINARLLRVERSVDGGRTWQRHEDAPTNSRTIEVTGLIPGRDYLFQVVAVNGAGRSQPSNAVPVQTATEVVLEAEHRTAVHEVGRRMRRAWSADVRKDDQGYLTIHNTQLDPGTHVARFRLMAEGKPRASAKVARIEVLDLSDNKTLASRTLRFRDFGAADVYREFSLGFELESASDIALRVRWLDKVDLRHDKTVILSWPATTAGALNAAFAELASIELPIRSLASYQSGQVTVDLGAPRLLHQIVFPMLGYSDATSADYAVFGSNRLDERGVLIGSWSGDVLHRGMVRLQINDTETPYRYFVLVGGLPESLMNQGGLRVLGDYETIDIDINGDGEAELAQWGAGGQLTVDGVDTGLIRSPELGGWQRSLSLDLDHKGDGRQELVMGIPWRNNTHELWAVFYVGNEYQTRLISTLVTPADGWTHTVLAGALWSYHNDGTVWEMEFDPLTGQVRPKRRR